MSISEPIVRINVYDRKESEYQPVRRDDTCCFGTIKKTDGIAFAIIGCIVSFTFLPRDQAIAVSVLICIVTMISISDNDRGPRPPRVFWRYEPFQPFSWTYRTVISRPYRTINQWLGNQGSYSSRSVDRVRRGEENSYGNRGVDRSMRREESYPGSSVFEYSVPSSSVSRIQRGEGSSGGAGVDRTRRNEGSIQRQQTANRNEFPSSSSFSSWPTSSTTTHLGPPLSSTFPPTFRAVRGGGTDTSNPSSKPPIEREVRGGGDGDSVDRVKRGKN